MRIKQLSVNNFKSLRELSVSPRQLTVVVGANGSGKSNFAEFLDFLAEIYEHGLEVAVARKGGYENIAHRRLRRSKGAIVVSVTSEHDISELRAIGKRKPNTDASLTLEVAHSFSFAAKGSSIRAEFQIVEEDLCIRANQLNVLQVTRRGGHLEIEAAPKERQIELFRDFQEYQRYLLSASDLDYFKHFKHHSELFSNTELFINNLGRVTWLARGFLRGMERIKVFQISPSKSREFGVPTPGPELDRTGANLPAVIDLLQKRYPDIWKTILRAMRRIMPELEGIDVGYTPNRTLGLFFREKEIGRPWNASEVSDGTIQTLAILVAIFDPRSSTLVLEELENSVHPWVIRNLLQACKDASRDKQIVLTTHSPVVLNFVAPEEVWVIWRSDGASHISPLVELDPSFLQLWQKGKVSTFDFLDSGALEQAVPPAPVVENS